MMKNRNKILLLVLSVMVSFILISCKANISNNDESDIVEDLYKYKSSYIGDNSNISGLVGLLPYGEYNNGIELSTSNEPYGLSVIYDIKDTDVNATDLKQELYNNALIIFTLIENVDNIEFVINEDANAQSEPSKFNRELIEQTDIDNLYGYSKDLETFDNFLYQKVYKSRDT